MLNSKIVFSILLCLTGSICVYSQNESNIILKAIKSAKQYIDDSAKEGIDSTYIDVTKYGWAATTSVNYAGISTNIESDNIPTYGNVGIDISSRLSGQTSVSLGYRGIALDYSWDISKGYNSDFSFSWFDNAWGFEYRKHSTDGLRGNISSSTTGNTLKIVEKDINVSATILDGYYILNSRRFSLPAALDQTYIQKRSAGSLIAMGTYIHSDISTDNDELKKRLQGIKNIEFYQIAVGMGYGYNLSINSGRMLMHGSFIPMAVIHNLNLISLDYSTQLPDGTIYETEISKKVKTKHSVYFTGLLRLGLTYNMNDHLFIAANGLLNRIRFDSNTDMKIRLNDWIVNTTLGVRF